MNVYSLYPPIALATVFNAFVLAALWRGHKSEIKIGEPPLWLIALIISYAGLISAFFYWRGEVNKPDGIYLFMSALAAEAFGGAVTFGILRALFFTRGMPIGEIIAAYTVAIGLLGLLIWGTIAFKP